MLDQTMPYKPILNFRKLMCLIILFLITVFIITACGGDGGTDPGSGEGEVIASNKCSGWIPMNLDQVDDIDDIDVNCCLTLNEDATMTESCSFRNNNSHEVRFAYCDMVDLINHPSDQSTVLQYILQYNSATDTLECVPDELVSSYASSYHFGCEEITISGNSQTSVDFVVNDVYEPVDGDVMATDFQVNYADIWDLTGTSTSFDSASCQGVTGQAGWLVPEEDPSAAAWAVMDAPFDDPFIRYQDADTLHYEEPLYVLFSDLPCAPPNFPITTEGFPRCPRYEGTPPPTEVELNLFWWVSHMDHSGKDYPTYMKIHTEGDMSGIRVQTEPGHVTREGGKERGTFMIPGGKEVFGSLHLCSTESDTECLPPNVEEGRHVLIRAEFYDAVTDKYLFPETVRFTKDTQPPIVSSHNVFNDGEYLTLSLVVTDETTSPTFANVWYSVDGGRSWEQEELPPKQNVVNNYELNTRTFTGKIEIGDAEEVLYFVAVQDAVSNITYFGDQFIQR